MGNCVDGLGWRGLGHMGGWGPMAGWGGGWLATLFGFTFLVGVMGLLALGAVWLARRSRLQPASAGTSASTPLDTARHRLAAGEITPEEFEELREQLES